MINPVDAEIIQQYAEDNSSGSCSVCGMWGAQFRLRSLLILCDYCHQDTPEKCTQDEFSEATGIAMNDPMLSSFWDDYLHSSYGDPKKYWQGCSTSGAIEF